MENIILQASEAAVVLWLAILKHHSAESFCFPCTLYTHLALAHVQVFRRILRHTQTAIAHAVEEVVVVVSLGRQLIHLQFT